MSHASVQAAPGAVRLCLWAEDDDTDPQPDCTLDMTPGQALRLSQALVTAIGEATK